MDDLAWSIYEYLLEESTVFEGNHLVLLPITTIAKKFERNHRGEGLIRTIIKKDYVALYWVQRQEDEE